MDTAMKMKNVNLQNPQGGKKGPPRKRKAGRKKKGGVLEDVELAGLFEVPFYCFTSSCECVNV
jgi:hypothetical protein